MDIVLGDDMDEYYFISPAEDLVALDGAEATTKTAMDAWMVSKGIDADNFVVTEVEAAEAWLDGDTAGVKNVTPFGAAAQYDWNKAAGKFVKQNTNVGPDYITLAEVEAKADTDFVEAVTWAGATGLWKALDTANASG